jgi:lysylphosphatidylglycerol synthetase-like protein (DUF2156 family)
MALPNALEMSGDVAAAATALAGLMLVFIGFVATSFESYQKQEQQTVRARFQFRVWIAFVGFVLSLLSAALALSAKGFQIECMATSAYAMLLLAFVFAFLGALSAARGIR